ncbi:MAG: ORF6N domain-containing protein [Clostridia bacterium]|nr:ORF6N domain-containing protein [Clostridia bacterium]
MSNENNIAPINEDLNVVKYEVEDIKQKIYTIRGKQVILDSDIAKLYEVETKKLNQAVKRNIERFPEEFCFQLNEIEMKNLRSQFVTSSLNKSNYGGRRYLPYAFTEQGVAMLSTVLHSDKAIKVSISIMKAFTEMRNFMITNSVIFERLTNVEYKLLEHDKKFEEVFNQFQNKENVKQKIFFDGQVYDAFSMIIDLIKKAKNEIVLIDNYVDIDTLNILSKKNDKVNVEIYTKSNTKLNVNDINKFNSQYPKLEVNYTEVFHDRFLILDKKCIYHIGASIKDVGKKCFGITLIKYEAIIKDILDRL